MSRINLQTQPEPAPSDDRAGQLLNQKDVIRITGVSKPTFTKWRKKGLVPKPVIESGGLLLWSKDQICEWLKIKTVD